VSDIDKHANNKQPDEQLFDDILDSDELFDLDMPLDEPDAEDDLPETEAADAQPDTGDIDAYSEMTDSLQDLMDDFPAADEQASGQKPEPSADTASTASETEPIASPEPESALESSEQESLSTLEQDLEQLLVERSDEVGAAGSAAVSMPTYESTPVATSEEATGEQPTGESAAAPGAQVTEATNDLSANPAGALADEPAADRIASAAAGNPPETSTPQQPGTAAPADTAPDSSPTQSRSALANNIMLTLGLAAMLIAALAVWLGLDARQQSTQLSASTPALQQRIKQLEQMQQTQQEQNGVLTRQIETLEKRIDTLTRVIAGKTAEQWRSAVARPRSGAPTAANTVMPVRNSGVAAVTASRSSSAAESSAQQAAKTAANRSATRVATSASKTAAKPASKPKQRPAAAPLARYEVAPGTVKGWVVNIYSVKSRNTAERKIRQLMARDIKAEYVRVKIKGTTWFRVRSSGVKNERAALAFKKMLKEYYGINDAWQSYLK